MALQKGKDSPYSITEGRVPELIPVLGSQHRDCDLNPGPSAPESSTLTTRLPSHPIITTGSRRPVGECIGLNTHAHTDGRTTRKHNASGAIYKIRRCIKTVTLSVSSLLARDFSIPSYVSRMHTVAQKLLLLAAGRQMLNFENAVKFMRNLAQNSTRSWAQPPGGGRGGHDPQNLGVVTPNFLSSCLVGVWWG